MANPAVPQGGAVWQAQRLLTLDAVYLLAVLVPLGLRPLLTPVPPHDFWWHMATGRLIAQRGAVPTVDSFSWTRVGEPFYNQSWLAQLLLYGLHTLGGVALIVLVQSAVLLVAYGLVLWLCVRRSERFRLAAGLVLLSLPLAFDNWNVRPQSYAFVPFAAFLFVLGSYRLDPTRYRRLLWLLPPLMVLWVNIHGSFVLGGVLLALTLLGEGLKRLGGQAALPWVAWRRLLLCALLTAAAVLVNPGGPAVLGYVGNLLGSSAVSQLVTEWAPPSMRELGGQLFFALLGLLFLLLIYARKRPDLTDLLLLFAFLWLALGATRNIVWFGMVALPLVAVQAGTLLPATRRRDAGSPLFNGLIMSLLLLLYVSALPWVKPALWPPPQGNLVAAETPVAAVTFMQREARRPERLFNNSGHGSYLLWALPEQRVFIDPRIELYPFAQWADYIALSGGYNVAELLAAYRIDGVLANNTDQQALLAVLARMPQWELRYRDEETSYYVLRR